MFRSCYFIFIHLDNFELMFKVHESEMNKNLHKKHFKTH